MRGGIDADHAQEVLAEHRRDAAERRGANQDELRPSIEKRERPAPAFAQVDIHAAGLRHRRRELRERQRAAEHDQSAEHPHAHHQTGSGTRVAMPAGVRKMPPPIVMPITRPIELKRPSRRTSVAIEREYYPDNPCRCLPLGRNGVSFDEFSLSVMIV